MLCTVFSTVSLLMQCLDCQVVNSLYHQNGKPNFFMREQQKIIVSLKNKLIF